MMVMMMMMVVDSHLVGPPLEVIESLSWSFLHQDRIC